VFELFNYLKTNLIFTIFQSLVMLVYLLLKWHQDYTLLRFSIWDHNILDILEHQSTYQTLRKYQWGHLRTVSDPLTAGFLYLDLEKYQNSLLQQNLFCKTCSTWKMTSIFPNGRRPLYFCEWKTTLTFWKMKDDLNIFANGGHPQYIDKWKTTSIFWQMEDDLNILANGILPWYFSK
jgi:hypothetical protein